MMFFLTLMVVVIVIAAAASATTIGQDLDFDHRQCYVSLRQILKNNGRFVHLTFVWIA